MRARRRISLWRKCFTLVLDCQFNSQMNCFYNILKCCAVSDVKSKKMFDFTALIVDGLITVATVVTEIITDLRVLQQ